MELFRGVLDEVQSYLRKRDVCNVALLLHRGYGCLEAAVERVVGRRVNRESKSYHKELLSCLYDSHPVPQGLEDLLEEWRSFRHRFRRWDVELEWEKLKELADRVLNSRNELEILVESLHEMGDGR